MAFAEYLACLLVRGSTERDGILLSAIRDRAEALFARKEVENDDESDSEGKRRYLTIG
jgi:hypothetical protein